MKAETEASLSCPHCQLSYCKALTELRLGCINLTDGGKGAFAILSSTMVYSKKPILFQRCVHLDWSTIPLMTFLPPPLPSPQLTSPFFPPIKNIFVSGSDGQAWWSSHPQPCDHKRKTFSSRGPFRASAFAAHSHIDHGRTHGHFIRHPDTSGFRNWSRPW